MGCDSSQTSDDDSISYNDPPNNNETPLNGNTETDAFTNNTPKQLSAPMNDDLFKTYAEIAQEETQRRATQVNESTDIFSRIDIKMLPNVEGTFGRIDNEESGEYIITYWSRNFEYPLFIPLVICDLIVKYIDMVYRSRWSARHKGPDFTINILDKCKATIPIKYAMNQSIRAVNCCLRDKVSVFYVTIKGFKNLISQQINDNFIGVITEYEDSFNLPLPKEGYGIGFEAGKIYKRNKFTKLKQLNKPKISDGKRVKCVVDLREGQHIFKCLWETKETKIKLPDPLYHENYKDIKWYPYISGYLTNMTCIIEFDEFTSKDDLMKNNGPPPPPFITQVQGYHNGVYYNP
eukprot:334211_1